MKSHRKSKEDLGLTVPPCNRLRDREGKRGRARTSVLSESNCGDCQLELHRATTEFKTITLCCCMDASHWCRLQVYAAVEPSSVYVTIDPDILWLLLRLLSLLLQPTTKHHTCFHKKRAWIRQNINEMDSGQCCRHFFFPTKKILEKSLVCQSKIFSSSFLSQWILLLWLRDERPQNWCSIHSSSL